MASKRGNRTTFRAEDVEEPEEHSEVDDETPLAEGPITNATEAPLFAGSDMTNKRSIAKLRLIKLDAPGQGYKGEIPLGSTLESIAQTYGDGLYNIEACNSHYKILRTLQNQRIALHSTGYQSEKATPALSLVGSNKDELDRVERLATQASQESVAQSNSFVTLVTTTMTAAAERERTFMAGVTRQSQDFAATMMTAQAQGFQQLMAMMQLAHTQTLEQLRSLPKGDDGTKLIAMLMRGIDMGRDLDEPDEKPFWQELLAGGTQLLTTVAGNSNKALAAPVDMPAAGIGPTKKKNSKRERMVKEMIALHKAVRARGIEPSEMIGMLESGVGLPGKPGEETEPEDSSDDIEESDESEDAEDDSDLDESGGESGESDDTGGDDTDSDTE